MGLGDEIKSDLVGLVRDPTDEQKAIVVAVIAMLVVDRYLFWIDTLVPFVVRTTVAVGAGFIALFITSYILTGQFVPPDGDADDEEEYEDEFHP